MTNIEFANALREIAAFYEEQPEMKQPHPLLMVFTDTKQDFLKAAITLSHGGTVQKRADPIESGWPRYHATRSFGPVTVDVAVDRKTVCRLIRAAEYECPDSLLEEAAEYTETA